MVEDAVGAEDVPVPSMATPPPVGHTFPMIQFPKISAEPPFTEIPPPEPPTVSGAGLLTVFCSYSIPRAARHANTCASPYRLVGGDGVQEDRRRRVNNGHAATEGAHSVAHGEAAQNWARPSPLPNRTTVPNPSPEMVVFQN